MIDHPPTITLGIGDTGERLVLAGEEAGQATDMASLLRMMPHLAQDGNAMALSQAVNHFAHGTDFRVIDDPKAFAAQYKARIEKEDPAVEWREGPPRLRNFGVPDFAKIEAPTYHANKLRFFAEDTYLGVPYVVELANLTDTADYQPMSLTPLPKPASTGKTAPAERETLPYEALEVDEPDES